MTGHESALFWSSNSVYFSFLFINFVILIHVWHQQHRYACLFTAIVHQVNSFDNSNRKLRQSEWLEFWSFKHFSLLHLAHIAQSLSCVQLCETPWTVACQSPQSMGFPRQEYWSGLPFPPPGDLPDPKDRTCISCISCIGSAIAELIFLPSLLVDVKG